MGTVPNIPNAVRPATLIPVGFLPICQKRKTQLLQGERKAAPDSKAQPGLSFTPQEHCCPIAAVDTRSTNTHKKFQSPSLEPQ